MKKYLLKACLNAAFVAFLVGLPLQSARAQHAGEDSCPPEQCTWGWSQVWTYPTPFPTATPTEYCGDNVCQSTENSTSCPADCGFCGNNSCTSGENSENCPEDCAYCGDNICSPPVETNANCPADCVQCGDGKCGRGENSNNCPADCANCGDHVCSSTENIQTCPRDCAECGDGICSEGENCPQDCDKCGNGVCDAGETLQNCVEDCAQCGDGVCSAGENSTNCVADCPLPPTATPTPATPTPTPTIQCPPGVEFSCNQKLNICACGRCAQDPLHPQCLGCFSPETKVMMADKSMRTIAQVKAGDQVWNPIAQKAMTVRYMTMGPEKIPMHQLGWGTTSIVVTQDHPIIVKNDAVEADWIALTGVISPASLNSEAPSNQSEMPKGYHVKRASDLQLGDKVFGVDGTFHKLTVLRKLPVKADQQVLNIRLETSSSDPDEHMLVADGVVTGDLWLQLKLEGKEEGR